MENATEREYPNRSSFLNSIRNGLLFIQKEDLNNFGFPLKIQIELTEFPEEAQPNEQLKEFYKNFVKQFNEDMTESSKRGVESIYKMLESEEKEFRDCIKERNVSDKVPPESGILSKCFV
jgi:hypothetical protein